ncbi:MAG: NAD-dependent deacylase [Calditrichaeota bacterium]|nr:NAD-dependent deacylase [Calditrichota bacterium]
MHHTESLCALLRDSRSISVLTGAGVSAESGVPTFRGKEGLWSKFKPEELANLQAFMANPELVWEWYEYRRRIIDQVQPNPGHYALAQWEKEAGSFHLITQNVDGLHQRAGSGKVIELHGNILHNRCLRCGNTSQSREVHFEGKVPGCSCGGMLRPDVVWFGETLPEKAIEEAFAAAETADLFLSVGTSAIVYPAASLPQVAKSSGAVLIEINVEHTALTPIADHFLQGPSGEILPVLFEKWRTVRIG